MCDLELFSKIRSQLFIIIIINSTLPVIGTGTEGKPIQSVYQKPRNKRSNLSYS